MKFLSFVSLFIVLNRSLWVLSTLESLSNYKAISVAIFELSSSSSSSESSLSKELSESDEKEIWRSPTIPSLNSPGTLEFVSSWSGSEGSSSDAACPVAADYCSSIGF